MPWKLVPPREGKTPSPPQSAQGSSQRGCSQISRVGRSCNYYLLIAHLSNSPLQSPWGLRMDRDPAFTRHRYRIAGGLYRFASIGRDCSKRCDYGVQSICSFLGCLSKGAKIDAML